ncbi:MAG: hypothetical protein MUE85_12600 [Microscillaceae bacterium]|jgi:hypothetical protein|nr:hypothetical protein [Microscillaceae bacterium]
MKKILFLSFLVLSISNAVIAQNDTIWGNDPIRAKERYTLFSDDVKAKDFKSAKNHLYWLINYKPKIIKAIYQDGAKVYEGLVATEADAKQKQVYQDSALLMYDMRIKYFNEEANVLNRKGGLAMTYWQNRPEKMPELYDLYKRIVELNGNNTFYYNGQYYMYLAAEMKKQNLKGIDDEKFLEIFNQLNQIIDFNIQKNDHLRLEWEKVKAQNNLIFEKTGNFDCNFVKKIYAPKYQENPRDTVMLEKITGLMLKGNCTTDPFFVQVITSLVKEQPSFKGYKTVAEYYRRQGDILNFNQYIQEALKYPAPPAEKAEVYLFLAQEAAKKGLSGYTEARNLAYQALKADPSSAGRVYSFVGDLYMNSATSCKGTDPSNPCHTKAVFIAAYEKYQQAGNTPAMNRARAYFPTKEEIFTHSMGGQKVQVGCWMNETITIPTLGK